MQGSDVSVKERRRPLDAENAKKWSLSSASQEGVSLTDTVTLVP